MEAMIDYERYWASAESWPTWLSKVMKHAELWHAVDARAQVPDDIVERLERVPGRWRLLVLSEDWCGDAVNLLPPIAALAERASNVELRVTGRDSNPELMNAHLTSGTRSIPVVVVLDDVWGMRGWWGPRPTPLQRWFQSELKAMPRAERYPLLRGWYARDRGRTSFDEIVALLEEAAGSAVTLDLPV